MAQKTALNARNLAALGADRLAQLLIEITKGNGPAKQLLRLELAGETGAADLVRDVKKRLRAISTSESFVHGQKLRALMADLQMQRRVIFEGIAPRDPEAAFDLIWRYQLLFKSLYERCDDSSGKLQGLFRAAGTDVLVLTERARPAPIELADRVADALSGDEWGHVTDLIPGLAPLMGDEGLAGLKARVSEFEEIGRASWAHRHALEQIADAESDVDAFIAQKDARSRVIPAVAAEIATRLLAAGRADEALAAIDAIKETRKGWRPFEWEAVRVNVLLAIGRKEDAQAFRWECFEETLNSDHLRAYLKELPDFEDDEAEARAHASALKFSDFNTALHFLVTWPALDQAAELVVNRSKEIDGHHYELLTPAAELLNAKHPLAASLLLRGLIDFALNQSRVKRYPHAARHLRECASLASRIHDFGNAPDHKSYVDHLSSRHGKKTSFWAAVGPLADRMT